MEHALVAFTDIRGELIGLPTLTAAGAHRNTGKLRLRDIQGAVQFGWPSATADKTKATSSPVRAVVRALCSADWRRRLIIWGDSLS